MHFTKYIACICEGAAEQAIIELLLDGEVVRRRGAKEFEQRYLRKGFINKITVLRILDSRRENFQLSKAYAPKIDVVNVITVLEIQMLVIIKEGTYAEYKRSGEKPSVFCKSVLKHNDVKSEAYFSDIDVLVSDI